MLKRILAGIIALGLFWLSWMVWQPPSVTTESQSVVDSTPERPGDHSGLWRVVTRRFIVPEAADQMRKTLSQQGLTAVTMKHRDEVELYAFDDPRKFASREDAVRARDAWIKAGFEAQVSKPDEQYGVSLGRLYMRAYAQQLQGRLQDSKRPYTYVRRQVTIPTWRFTFPAMSYADAQALWTKVQATGMADPVLMQEGEFQSMYGGILTGQQGDGRPDNSGTK